MLHLVAEKNVLKQTHTLMTPSTSVVHVTNLTPGSECTLPAGQVDQRHFAAYMEERLTGGGGGGSGGGGSSGGSGGGGSGGGGEGSGRGGNDTSPHARMEHVRRVFKVGAVQVECSWPIA
jgi:uncharacterized membrane protein YgcG